MNPDLKRKRWNIENYLNIAPCNTSKFKYEDGREISNKVEAFSRSETTIYKLQNIRSTLHFLNQEFDFYKTVEENLILQEKTELKEWAWNQNSNMENSEIQEENRFELITNKSNSLIRQINENKRVIVKELEKMVKTNQFVEGIEKCAKVYRDIYRKIIIDQNDSDFETNKIFESFQKKINDLNMNPLKQQYNSLIKAKRNVEKSIKEAEKNGITFLNKIQQNTNLLMTIEENVNEFEKKIAEKSQICLAETNQNKSKFKETFKNMLEIRLLKEQINILRVSPRNFCVIKQKNLMKKNIFNYETYLKISKSNKFLSLFANEKFINPLKTVPKMAIEENFHTPLKERYNELNEEEKNQKKCMSESDNKFLKNKQFIKKTNISQGAYKFDLIIDNQYNNFYFSEDYSKKLYFELEIFLKGSFIRNWENLLKNVSFSSLDYDFFLNLKNDFYNYNKIMNDDVLNNLRLNMNKMEIETEDDDKRTCSKKEKQDYLEKHLGENYYFQSNKKVKSFFPLPAINLIFIGDKDRGIYFNFLKIMIEDLMNFENEIIKIVDIKYSFDTAEPQKFITNNCNEIIGELKNVCFEKNERRKIIVLNLFFEINHKNNDDNIVDSKRISLILFNLSQIENNETLFKHLLNLLNKEKLSVQKDKNVEVIENLCKQNSKIVIINEFPNLLKLNKNSCNKYEKIQRILEFNKKLIN